MPAPQREVVDTEHLDRVRRRVRQCSDQSQQGGSADVNAQTGGQSRTGSPGQGETDPLENPAQQRGASGIGTGQPFDLFREGSSGALDGQAQEPTYSQDQTTGPVTDRGVGEGAIVSTVDPPRHALALALRTRCGLGQRGHPDSDPSRGYVDGIDRDTDQVWE